MPVCRGNVVLPCPPEPDGTIALVFCYWLPSFETSGTSMYATVRGSASPGLPDRTVVVWVRSIQLSERSKTHRPAASVPIKRCNYFPWPSRRPIHTGKKSQQFLDDGWFHRRMSHQNRRRGIVKKHLQGKLRETQNGGAYKPAHPRGPASRAASPVHHLTGFRATSLRAGPNQLVGPCSRGPQ